VDGLSVERLTLLGRVSVARVTIDQLKLVGYEQNTTPSKKRPASKSIGRPPKPSPKAKKAV
jgi:C2 domain-containing protein 3